MNATIEATDELTDVPTSVALVDHALGVIGPREILARDDALKILHDVGTAIHDGAPRAILDGVADACQRDSLVSRCRLVDSLLDMRLALVTDAMTLIEAVRPEGAAC